MTKSVKIKKVYAPSGELFEFDPGAYLNELEFYETETPINEDDRDGLAQLVHYLAFLALNYKSSAWPNSIVARPSSAFDAIDSHFSHLDEWSSIVKENGIEYRSLASILMAPYPPKQ